MEKRYAPQLFQTKEIDRDKFTIRFVMSTAEIDRHGEVVSQDGWNFNNFLKNPVVLWGHDQSIPAVGKIISIEKVNGATEGVVQFAYNENPDAKILFDLYAGGYMNAVSVGFMNTKWMYDEEKDILTLLENELFELSLVNVPANASALAKAKNKGLDTGVIVRLNKGNDVTGDDRFKNLGEQIVKEEKEEEAVEVTPEDPKKPEDEVPGDVTPTGEEPAPEKTDAEPADEEVKAAIETLSKANATKLKEAIGELTSKSKDVNDGSQKVDTTPTPKGHGKRYSTHAINRALRVMMTETSKAPKA